MAKARSRLMSFSSFLFLLSDFTRFPYSCPVKFLNFRAYRHHPFVGFAYLYITLQYVIAIVNRNFKFILHTVYFY